MAGPDAFQVEGVVRATLPNGTYRVELANGHLLLGFVPGRGGVETRFAPGDRVKLGLTPYDLSSGRILIETKEH